MKKVDMAKKEEKAIGRGRGDRPTSPKRKKTKKNKEEMKEMKW